MKGPEIIEKALQILGAEKPNVLYIGGDVKREYLLFYETDEPNKAQIEELNKIGCEYVGKYECIGIEREILWDAR